MRIGIHLRDDTIAAVAQDRGGYRGETKRPIGPDLGSAVERLLRELKKPGSDVDAVIVDVSESLKTDPHQQVVSVLIEPRLPAAPRKHLWAADGPNVRVVQVRGGHNALGQELVPLDEAALNRAAESIPAGAHVVISAAGSRGNPEHERRAAELLRPPTNGSVTESHIFPSDSLLARENTAVVNALLRAHSERLSALLTVAVARGAGESTRIFVCRNDGGCSPIARLPITPIHSLASAPTMEMLGAADLLELSDGRLVLAAPGRVQLCELHDGLFPVARRLSPTGIEVIASSFAQVVPLTDLLLSGAPDAPVALVIEGAESGLVPFGLEPTLATGADLVARGAVNAQLSHWYNAVIHVEHAADVARALSDGQAIVRANLVAAGADVDQVRIVESRVLATSYGESQMVQVRVRGVAGAPSRTWVVPTERSVA